MGIYISLLAIAIKWGKSMQLYRMNYIQATGDCLQLSDSVYCPVRQSIDRLKLVDNSGKFFFVQSIEINGCRFVYLYVWSFFFRLRLTDWLSFSLFPSKKAHTQPPNIAPFTCQSLSLSPSLSDCFYYWCGLLLLRSLVVGIVVVLMKWNVSKCNNVPSQRVI